ncbi:MAG: GldG family protein, partial [Anaerolineae bacterium]|nr:GldG family protein [Anaerolineae bacterium]
AALSGRTAQQGANATVVTLAIVGILVLLNVLAARHHQRFDLTAEREFSLSRQTLQVLSGLQEPVAVTAFMTGQYYARQDVEDLLKEYTYHTDKLSLEFVDLEQRPGLALQQGVTRDGTVIFQVGERRQETLGYDEQAFTSALVKVTRQEAKAVYFLTGHGERDPQDSAQTGYQQVATALERDNYRVETLNLAITATVPSDAAVLVIAAPTLTPTTREMEAINAYADRGGSLLILGDPASDVSLDDLLSRWGVSLRRDVIIDPASSFFGDVATPLISRYPYHDISKDLLGLTTVFPVAQSVAQQDSLPEGVQVSPLVSTSSQSWGETDREARQVRFDEGKDRAGPLDLAVAATRELALEGEEEEPRHARLVLFGDADLVANDLLLSIEGSLGNQDLFLNAVSWLAEEESLISIRPRPPTQRTVLLTPPQVRLLMLTSLLFLPGAVVVAGAWVWWRRR